MNRIAKSEVRGAGLLGPNASREYRALEPEQALALVREPDNPADANAIILVTGLAQPCGYLAKEDAARIAPRIDAGEKWFAKVLRPGRAMRYAEVKLWRERA